MRMVLLGPPGCGKGTQGERLAKKYKVPRLSTGEILRAAIKAKTPLGEKAASYMNRGNLVPDDVIVGLMAVRTREADCKNGYILDGVPRTIGQAKGLDKILADNKLDVVLNIIVPEDDIVKRLGGRRQCSSCGALYHVEFSPPRVKDVCDKCKSGLFQRDDDKIDTIRNRIRVYKEETAPLIDYYKAVVKNVDGKATPDEIYKRICSLID